MATANMEFLTREELLSFRTATTLLGYLEVLEKRDEAERGKVVNLEAYSLRGRTSDVFLYSKLSQLADLLVRSNELIAVLPGGESRGSIEITAVLEDLPGPDADDELTDSIKDLYMTSNPKQ